MSRLLGSPIVGIRENPLSTTIDTGDVSAFGCLPHIEALLMDIVAADLAVINQVDLGLFEFLKADGAIRGIQRSALGSLFRWLDFWVLGCQFEDLLADRGGYQDRTVHIAATASSTQSVFTRGTQALEHWAVQSKAIDFEQDHQNMFAVCASDSMVHACT